MLRKMKERAEVDHGVSISLLESILTEHDHGLGVS